MGLRNLFNPARLTGQAVAPGIYGTIVCASVMAASGPGDDAVDISLAVLVTLIVYWMAERYAELMAARLEGKPFNRATVRAVLRRGWPMVQASYTPLAVLLVARLLGASVSMALGAAMIYTTLLLSWLGWAVGRRIPLTRCARFGPAAFSGLLGLILILLKLGLH